MIESENKDVYNKNMEKKFPNIHTQQFLAGQELDREYLPKLLRNEKDKLDFANRHTDTGDTAMNRRTAATKLSSPDGRFLESQPGSQNMLTTNFQQFNIEGEDGEVIQNLKQGNNFDNNETKGRNIHSRTQSLVKPKMGKTAIGHRRRDINPNNLFLRRPANVTTYSKDPSNQYMKKPFLENLQIHHKNFYTSKKEFISLFEDITKINLVFSEIIETVLWYRPKLAQTLSNLNLSYNKLYEKLLDQYHKSEIEKDKDLQIKMQTTMDNLEKFEYAKVELEK